ncbi:MAG: hypothetical protein PQJ59_01620 [Spirochaetales bacterium]|nr:hypothetical protein [Spirochaetales bacterium]
MNKTTIGEMMKFRKLLFILLAISLAVIATGCLEPEGETANSASQEKIVETKNATLELRIAKIDELNGFAEANSLKATFSKDPNDDTTLCFYRESSSSADMIDFTNSVYGYGTTIEDLKAVGFNKVRIYSSKDGYKKYSLTIL